VTETTPLLREHGHVGDAIANSELDANMDKLHDDRGV
jgi:hypothetical protein